MTIFTWTILAFVIEIHFLAKCATQDMTLLKDHYSGKEIHLGDPIYLSYHPSQFPRDCNEVYEMCENITESGIFQIHPDDAPEPFEVYCNNSVDGGKWTVFQRRMDGSVDFYRTWIEYKSGFDFLRREFWLGNDNLAYLTNQKDYELRIDFVNSIGTAYHAKYDLFRISDEWTKYRLVDLGQFLQESTAGRDALVYHRNMSFSTYDNDNDVAGTSYGGDCALYFHGAWWYKSCYHSNLNGDYFGCTNCTQSIRWNDPSGHLFNIKYSEMKIRHR